MCIIVVGWVDGEDGGRCVGGCDGGDSFLSTADANIIA